MRTPKFVERGGREGEDFPMWREGSKIGRVGGGGAERWWPRSLGASPRWRAMLPFSGTWTLCALVLAAIPPSLPFSTLIPSQLKPATLPHWWNPAGLTARSAESVSVRFRPVHGCSSTKPRRSPPVLCVANEAASLSASAPPPNFRPPGLRLIANEEETLAAGAIALLPEHMSQHAVKIRKVRVGHGLRVFNARCGEWCAPFSSRIHARLHLSACHRHPGDV